MSGVDATETMYTSARGALVRRSCGYASLLLQGRTPRAIPGHEGFTSAIVHDVGVIDTDIDCPPVRLFDNSTRTGGARGPESRCLL
jgi:hypothetical protein